MSVHIDAKGAPAAQGSMRHIGNGRMISMSKKLPGWRKAVIAAAKDAHGEDFEPLDGALTVHLDLYLSRPATTKFPDYPAGTPDLDKLQRAIGDALKLAGTITDDARIVSWHAHKHWAIGREPGALITIYEKGTCR
jgi:crossover junction endodeoxyribonuclease RusA